MDFEQAARQSQKAFEPFTAMIFFVPEAPQRYKTLGLNSRQGYFYSRSAAMGAVPAAVVAATFYNFNPTFISKLMEQAWAITSPEAVLRERHLAVGEALRRLLAPAEGEPELTAQIEQALPLVKRAVANLPVGGRALFAAHSVLDWPEDPLVALWHGVNLLREFRGDGHIAALLVEGIGGPESLLMQAAYSPRLPFQFLVQSRAWGDVAIEMAQARLVQQGLLVFEDGKPGLTEAGAALRSRIEQHTDRLDSAPFEALGDAGTTELLGLIAPLSRRVIDHGGLNIVAPSAQKPA